MRVPDASRRDDGARAAPDAIGATLSDGDDARRWRKDDAIAATRRSHRCHYEGRTATNYPSGKTFDSSYARGQPTTFAPRQVIAAWTEARQKRKVGSKWELVCPPESAYGGRAMGSDIPANSVLVFTMEMLSCQGVSAEL